MLKGKVYEWEISKKQQKESAVSEDLPEAYRVSFAEAYNNGCFIEAKYNGKWVANPWNIRALVKHLLEEYVLAKFGS